MIVELQPREVVTLFLRRFRLFCGTASVVVALGAGYLLWATPKYRSEAIVVVRFDDKAIPATNMAKDSSVTVTAQSDRHETVLAHADILTSYDLAKQVIEQIGIDKLYPEIVEDPPSVGTPMDEAIRTFGKNLFVDPEQQGDAINLSFDHPSRTMARTVLTDVINDYMEREADIFTHPNVTFQEDQAKRAAAEVQRAQADLANYKAENGITSFDDQMTALIKARTDLNAALQGALVNQVQATKRRDELSRQLQTVSATLNNSASGEKYHSVDDAQATLDTLRGKEQQMTATYRGSSPVLDQLRAAIASASADLKSRQAAVSRRDSSAPNLVYQNIQTDLIRAQADTLAASNSAGILQGQLATLDATMTKLEAAHAGLLQRLRALDVADSTYRSMALHLADAQVDAGMLKDRISHGAIITAPTLPYKVAKPKYLILSAAFVLAGILMGIGAVLLAELMSDNFETPGQIRRRLGIPVLATLD